MKPFPVVEQLDVLAYGVAHHFPVTEIKYHFLKDKNKHDVFFDYNVKKSKTIQMLRNHPSSCEKHEFAEKWNFSFKGDSAEILNDNLPFKPLQCKPIDKKRIFIYFQGYLDSATHSLAGFSTIID